MFYEVVPGKHDALVSTAHTSPFVSTPPDLAMDYVTLTNKDASVPRTSDAEEEKLTPSAAPSSLDQRLNS